MDLEDHQHDNLFYVLDKANSKQMSILKEEFNVKLGKTLEEKRDQIIHYVMSDTVNFNFFTRWLSQVYLNLNNTIYIFEPEHKSLFKKYNYKYVSAILNDILCPVYEIHANSIIDIQVIDYQYINLNNQMIISLAAPSLVMDNSKENPTTFKDVYFGYIIIDYNKEHITLSLYPQPHVYSINNIETSNRDLDKVANNFINFFKKNIWAFNSTPPEWIVFAMSDIVDEYFNHNNPLIDKKLDEFKENHITGILDILEEAEKSIDESNKLRLSYAIGNAFESELIEIYKTQPNKSKFEIFLHEADKGIVSFKANSKGKPLTYADSRNVVKMMMESSYISSLGITYSEDEHNYPYKITKLSTCFCLKRATTAYTPKEIVDNVLYNLNEYKTRKETENDSSTDQESR